MQGTQGITLEDYLVREHYRSWNDYLLRMAEDGHWEDHLAVIGISNSLLRELRVCHRFKIHPILCNRIISSFAESKWYNNTLYLQRLQHLYRITQTISAWHVNPHCITLRHITFHKPITSKSSSHVCRDTGIAGTSMASTISTTSKDLVKRDWLICRLLLYLYMDIIFLKMWYYHFVICSQIVLLLLSFILPQSCYLSLII